MRDLDCTDQVRDAASRYGLKDCVFKNSPTTNVARSSEQQTLHRISSNLTGHAARPSDRWSVEAFSLEPIWIAASGVHGRFEAPLKRIRLVVLQPISGESAFLL